MATLTDASVIARKGVRYGIYLIILLIVGKFALDFGIATYKQLFPPPPPKPTVAFGQLPAIPFPPRSGSQLSYKLETPDGKLPTTVSQIEVYFMPSPQSSLQSLESAKAKARSLGFADDGKVVVANVPNVYAFNKINEPSNLVYNIITKVYSVSYDISSNPSVLSGIPPANDLAITQARSFFSQGGSLPTDISEGTTKTELLKIDNGKFVKALSLSEAQITKVNLFRNNFGSDKSITVVTPDYPEANIWAMIASNNKVVVAEYHYFPIDLTKKGTYPLKSSSDAWKELNEGKAFIVRDNNNSTNIVIRRVYLAYFDPGQYSEYFQPVFVFEGDNDFYAFVPAVRNDLYGKEEATDN